MIHYSEQKGGYFCPTDGVNPKPGLLSRFFGGVTDVTTQVATSSAQVAGAAMGARGSIYHAQANMEQVANMPPPPPALPDPNAVKCINCGGATEDYSHAGPSYAGLSWCLVCKDWTRTPTPAVT